MAVALCSPDAALLSKTRDFPSELSCDDVEALRPASERAAGRAASVDERRVPPRRAGARECDSAGRRERVARLRPPRPGPQLRRTARGSDASASSSLRSASSPSRPPPSRSSRRGSRGAAGRNEIRTFLQGGAQRAEFQPILRDVRELVDRIVADTEADREVGSWTPERLKHTLNRHLHGEKVVDRRQPRAVHPRAIGRRQRSLDSPPGERPRDGARARDACMFGHVARPRQRLR